ncbi:HlyD family secretion protein [Geothrix sp. 21YS21S-2]|uniref:HlyD family secretion protein n=1 Tax=Geothrix sp. 21YS21S-2 TaxID=3068893 RepID=UPI0027B89625|nr:HlyD family efflux transporter periplasmic adaptor subunit [Geothrix sp. 21YS21S-2]
MNENPPSLFRQEALDHRLEGEEGRGLVRVSPPWTWALLMVFLSGVGTALLASLFGRAEVNGRARGILRPRSGIRVVIAQLDGTVGQVEARSGQQVEPGAVLVRIEAPPVQARLLEARRQVESVRSHYKVTTALQDRSHAEQLRRLEGRMAMLKEQSRSQRQSLAIMELNLQRSLNLEREGVLSPAKVDEAREALAQSQRQLSQSGQALEMASQEWAALENGRQDSLWQRRQTIQGAEVRAEALAFLAGQTLIQAPEGGRVEAMLVKPGEAVRAGQALCKLIPRNASLEVVAFLEEKDRAFVRPGDAVRLELDQLPYAEYGTVAARVERISDDLASAFEIREALGDNPFPHVPAFRVELGLTDTRAVQKAGIPLRSGMLLNVRFTLRRQRLITLVLDPLRKWLR